MSYEFLRYVIAGAIGFWLGMVFTVWYIGR